MQPKKLFRRSDDMTSPASTNAPPLKSGYHRIVLLGIILGGWAWRLAGLTTQSLWRDEVDSLRFATRSMPEVLAAFTRPGENGPLYYLLLRPWLHVGGQSEFSLRYPSAWLGILAIPLIYQWGRYLFRRHHLRWGSILAALLLAVNPYHVWYSQEARMYSLIVVMILVVLWTFKEAIEKGKWWRWGLWYIFISLSFYIHVLSVLVLAVIISWVLFLPTWRRRWRSALGALTLLILPYLPLIGWQWALLTNTNFRTGHPFVPFGKMMQTLFSVQLLGVLPAPNWIFSLAFFLLGSAILLPPLQKKTLGLLSIWWLWPPIILYIITTITPLFTDRYLIWILPALLLLLALGTAQLAKQNQWLAGALIAGLLLFQIHQGWKQLTTTIKPDIRAAATYVAARRQANDLTIFLMPYIRYTYRYYDPGRYAWAEAPYANREPDASQVPSHLERLTRGYAGVWLIESEAAFYDRKGLIRSWLDAHATLENEAHFTFVDVFYYRFTAE